MTKHMFIWVFPEGPNPLKVKPFIINLTVSKCSFRFRFLSFLKNCKFKRINMKDVKEPLTKLSPNGRVPGMWPRLCYVDPSSEISLPDFSPRDP
ncbi:hypothetical protein F5Y13DRAFT_189561 [Hypoxylon sp. FL1857]|nr:hypothetical protein F5Y13DRAFT_189561 [Hypoxylon sp. FL1857]